MRTGDEVKSENGEREERPRETSEQSCQRKKIRTVVQKTSQAMNKNNASCSNCQQISGSRILVRN